MDNRKELLVEFDRNAAESRTALANASDQDMLKGWKLLAGGKEIFTMPRIAGIRGMVMNHLIHHRAQLGVYFRLLRIPVPRHYGPRAAQAHAPARPQGGRPPSRARQDHQQGLRLRAQSRASRRESRPPRRIRNRRRRRHGVYVQLPLSSPASARRLPPGRWENRRLHD